MTDSSYDTDLGKSAANYVPLSPLSFIKRTAAVFPDHTAVIYGDVRRSWAETYRRCRRLAGALAKLGIGKGDTVSVLAANTPEPLEAHFGVPMTGAVLNAMNVRLDAATIAFMLEHCEAKVLITDREYAETAGSALAALANPPLVIDIDDPAAVGGDGSAR